VAHSFCTAVKWLSEPKKQSDIKLSVVLQSVYAGSALTYLLFFQEDATPPQVQVCHCTWSVLPGPPPR